MPALEAGAAARAQEGSSGEARAVPMLLGAALLSLAIGVHPGYFPVSFILLTLSLGAFGFACFASPRWMRMRTESLVPIAGIAGLLIQVAWIISTPQGWGQGSPLAELRLHLSELVTLTAFALSIALVLVRPRPPWLWAGALFVCCGALTCWAVLWSPVPWLDVDLFHRQAFEALAAHHSPYGGSIENIYRGLPFYSADVLSPDQSRVLIGYPYPPLQLLLAWLGETLLGNYRLLHALAFPASAALLYFARPSRASAAAAGLCALLPSACPLVEGSWTEPVLILLLSLSMFAAVRAPRLLPWALGLFFADKQYALMIAPLAFFLLPQPVTGKQLGRAILKVCVIGLLVTAPLALTNLQGFLDDVLMFQVRQPFRPDSLSFAALLYFLNGTALPAVTAFIPFALALLLCWRFAPRDAQGFACSAAFAFGLFFASGKQSFGNYLTFVAACGLWGAALAEPSVAAAAKPLPDEPNVAASEQKAQLVTQGT